MGIICTLVLSKSGVKVGFVNGAELADPTGLLEGSGKKHKYIQLKTVSDHLSGLERKRPRLRF
jgi:hypothetical protein